MFSSPYNLPFMYTRKVLAGQNCVLDAFASGMRAGVVKEERTRGVKETVEKVEREPKEGQNKDERGLE